MTNDERIKKRIERDKQRKEMKRLEQFKDNNDITEVATLRNGLDAVADCRKSVNWKPSVHKYTQTVPDNVFKTVKILRQGTIPKPTKTKKQEIRERGKIRVITPIAFSDRVTQRILCEHALLPVVENSFIYDNCASRTGKGTDFARQRVMKFLQEAVKLWGDDFYILITDFKSFFDSVPHQTCYNVLNKHFVSETIVNLIMQVIHSYYVFDFDEDATEEIKAEMRMKLENNEMSGMCLGSQVSQVLALLVPNELDHFIKDKKGVKFDVRYMDDNTIFHNDKDYLFNLYEEMKVVVGKLGLKFNDKKTRIVSARKGFTFLKIHYRVDGNQIITTINHKSVVRQRRKLKKLHQKYLNGERTLEDAYNSMNSWLGTLHYTNHHYHTEKSMLKLYDELFDGYKITNKWFRMEEQRKADLKRRLEAEQNAKQEANQRAYEEYLQQQAEKEKAEQEYMREYDVIMPKTKSIPNQQTKQKKKKHKKKNTKKKYYKRKEVNLNEVLQNSKWKEFRWSSNY